MGIVPDSNNRVNMDRQSAPAPAPAEGVDVSLTGISPTKAKAGITATLSLLSEDETFCTKCKGRIDGLAVYVTRPRGERRQGYELVAIVHQACYEGEVG